MQPSNRSKKSLLGAFLVGVLIFGCNQGDGSRSNDDQTECNDRECQNGAECLVEDNQTRCDCVGGYSGELCEVAPEECDPNPCQNGSRCSAVDDGYECECRAGFSGENCEESPPACSPNPCQNGGDCSAEDDGDFSCDCERGYSGDECEIADETCDPNPCQNEGTCSIAEGGFLCECTEDYWGITCEDAISACEPNPCLYGGRCTSTSSGYSCECLQGYNGDRCEDAPAACLPNPCENNGICFGDDENFSCDCPITFVGETCQTPASSGLSNRPDSSSCVAPERAASNGPLAWVGYGPYRVNLMMIRQSPSLHWYEVYRNGEVYVVSPDGVRGTSPLLALSVPTTIEMGLWGLALHPHFESEPFIYLYYSDTEGPDGTGRGVVARYRVDSPDTTPTIDASSRTEIFVYERGHSYGAHWGGTIEFHPTATGAVLYLATGNGGTFPGSGCDYPDPSDSANGACVSQYMASYLGKLIRLDVSDSSGGATYTPEIVGLGLRNPFRWSFDSETGDLWLADVGEANWEELNYVPNEQIPGPGDEALNFGFPCREGFVPFSDGTLCDGLSDTVQPIHAYRTEVGVSIIGGRVYRGSQIAGLSGRYFFSDYFPQDGTGVWSLVENPADDPTDPTDDYIREELEGPSSSIAGYAEGVDGELYLVANQAFRLEAQGDGSPPEESMASTLSETGCFDDEGRPAAGLISFEVRAGLWSDGATKRRWLSIPNGTSITLDGDGDFVFPNGTILAKEFTQDGVRVETRLLVLHPDGVWEGYTYAWLDDGGNLLGDAVLVSQDASTRDIPGTSRDWVYPSRGQCQTCHTSAAGHALGLEVAQLNFPYEYPDGDSTSSQIFTLNAIGVLGSPIDEYRESMRLAAYDEETSAENLARAYLHSNCSGCHQEGAPGFGGRSNMPDVAYRPAGNNLSLAQLFCGVTAGAEDLGLGQGALLAQPGQPGSWDDLDGGASVLYLRMGAREDVPGSSGTMPQIGTREVDQDTGMRLIGDWIDQLNCP